MFCFVPLLAMETIIPTPARITTPITIQVVSMFCRMPSFQSAARTPPMSKTNPRKYIPAHFMAHLLIGPGPSLLDVPRPWTVPCEYDVGTPPRRGAPKEMGVEEERALRGSAQLPEWGTRRVTRSWP